MNARDTGHNVRPRLSVSGHAPSGSLANRTRFRWTASIGAVLLALAPAFSAATSPPPGWTNERVIECSGIGVLTTYLEPAGFGTPFNVVGSNTIIIPKYVEVTIDGQTFVTVDVPGFDIDGVHAVHCWYTDPRGLFVEFLGIMTAAPN